MQTKLNLRKVLALGATLAMLATSALASSTSSWPVYGGNANHNSVVSGAPTSIATGYPKQLNLTSTTGWDGVDNVPVMQTVDGVTYAYVLFDGYGTNGAQVVKVNCATGGEVWRTTAQQTPGSLNAKSGFQLSTPYLDDSTGTLYVGVISAYTYDPDTDEYLQNSKSKILALTNLDAAQPTVSEVLINIDGQINTPIVKYGSYIYFGTWPGGSNAGKYYQVDVSTTSYTYKTFTPESYGFYWAGAVKSGNYIYFGSDNGKLYYRQAGPRFDSTAATAGGVLDLTDTTIGGASDAGNVRSTVMLDDGKLYFTSQGGYLWCCTVGSGGAPAISWKASLGGTSTSTPTKVGDRIYVGYYSGFSAGGVQCVGASGSHTVTTVASGFPVQCSILVQGAGTGTDYLYFNTNSDSGAGYCYSYNGSTGTSVWSTDGDTYALGGMAYDNGYLVFGNDKNHLYVVK
ncbi:hypothetical protein [Intestinimonas butyriciproducens]|uniref:hypothetical protein n=1 Tax=Intestinimonas butyriciproducens TaxID=1297617 RepID=UPI00242B39B3